MTTGTAMTTDTAMTTGMKPVNWVHTCMAWLNYWWHSTVITSASNSIAQAITWLVLNISHGMLPIVHYCSTQKRSSVPVRMY